MKKTWKLLNSTVERQDNNYTWTGVIANETRNMIYKSLREQGISIDLQGIKFYNDCIDKTLDEAVKTVSKMYASEVESLINA